MASQSNTNTDELMLQLQSLHKMKTPKKGDGYLQLNLLSKRKCELEKCELCENTAQLVCDQCKVTYYCTMEHFMLDKRFHALLCEKIKSLKAPLEFHPLSETRERWRKQRRIRMEELYLYTLKNSQTDLAKGDFESAIPSATSSTKYAQILYGQSEELVSPLVVASECHLKRGNIAGAEGFLARALCIEVTESNIRPCVKARIRHVEGLISLAREDLQGARESFAEAVYQNSEQFGTDHIKTSENYCHLGRVFHLSGEFLISTSLLRQTVRIWIAFLEPIYDEMNDETKIPNLVQVHATEKQYMDECDKYLGDDLLTRCYDLHKEAFLRKPHEFVTGLDIANICYALGIMFYIYDRFIELHERVTEALFHMEQGQLQEHPLHKKLQTLQKNSNRKSFQQSKGDSSSLDESNGK